MFLTITSVDKILFQGEAESLTAPGSDGELTILAHHEPLITTLTKGTITVRERGSDEPKTFDIEKGVLEVGGNKAVVLV